MHAWVIMFLHHRQSQAQLKKAEVDTVLITSLIQSKYDTHMMYSRLFPFDAAL